MIIEFLKFKMPAELRETFIQKDEEIWTTVLSKYPGFLGKEVWISPDDLTEVVIVVHWQNREQWKAISETELEAIAQKFDQYLGFSYEMSEASEYQVRKFPQH
ncbi:TIGR03792 family protein [Anabaena sphaerica FACHB-251]|uniref:TIGR03792 family protein n=1 Tax=Anabaena sphaerica FACHB-251 TaxID=2692883 RepID=A0A927A1D4_9NOST|nr:TIGR03792 family protein [Anabaena sphaerica]MBD2294353.1 TIGR03792 family protein [Anabaena sphaerica FACHB-251]